MVKRFIVILVLLVALIGGVITQQIYTDTSLDNVKSEVISLQTDIEQENLEKSEQRTNNLKDYWANVEMVLSLFVDYREIEQIGRQIELISQHLDNEDFELASVECGLLLHVVETYQNTISFDWHNIIQKNQKSVKDSQTLKQK